MPVWRLQTEISMDSTLPRDVLTMTPHFNDGGVGSDPQGLCDDLAAAISTWSEGAPKQIVVTAYDAQGTVPVLPQGRAVVNAGASPVSDYPREIAVCLSFYSGQNRPRWRGRLYVPFVALAPLSQNLGARPPLGVRNKVAALAPIFEGLGGVDVDWSIYSRVDDVARPVTNWWVDDEWDTVRSRGLRPTTRNSGTTSEG